jgi:hypothetical protein
MDMLMFMEKFGFQGGLEDLLSPSVHKFDYEHIYSGLSAALGYEQFGLELTAERLGPNGVSVCSDPAPENTSLYLRIEALSLCQRCSAEIQEISVTKPFCDSAFSGMM